ncbi:hypothetical protein CKO25_07075 [Thiocapsa imhoffii]|uniref:Methyltransferase FkbM domain-containing protein n=1 Tax=Thiocapsa imhoffii TaxID=382777 RepID=A0A9X0WHW8_9GAMM|nr:FkbM family methyltransferase [Thiocapsa imhoffii]MBK1644422.1 hypothetical protein [Thiocapsa imhoffii]
MSDAKESSDGAGMIDAVKTVARKVLQVDAQSLVTPLPQVTWVGSEVHGYPVPEGFLDADSICYCVGAGEDITFDTELAERFGCQVLLIDPTPEGCNHFNRVKDHINRGEPLWSENGEPFRYRIRPERLELLRYLEIGVWDSAQQMRFYEPTRDNYPSHSVAMFQESGRYIELPVDRLGNIMRSQGHTAIDLLKLEIEGAEYRVLETVIEDQLDIKAILVEYDEVWHSQDRSHLFRIRDSAQQLLQAGYRLAHSTDRFKRLFIRDDLFEDLAGRE